MRGPIGALDSLVGQRIAWGIAMVLLARLLPVARVSMPAALLWYGAVNVVLYSKRLSSLGPVAGGRVGVGQVGLSVWRFTTPGSSAVLGWAVVAIMLGAAAVPTLAGGGSSTMRQVGCLTVASGGLVPLPRTAALVRCPPVGAASSVG